MMPNVIGNLLLFTMAEALLVGYYECGDNSKTPPNAPHCLLLWRKPPPGDLPGGGIALITLIWKSALLLMDREILFSSRRERRTADRHDNKEGTPLPQVGFDPNPSLVCIHNALDNRKPQT